MNGKPDQATPWIIWQIERLTRRSTLADPAALARNRNKQASLRCVGIMRLNRRQASQEGRGDVRGRGARGLRETKAEALQAKRIRLAGRRETFTPLGSLPLSFLMRIRQRTPTVDRQDGQSASRLSHSRRSTSLAQRTGHPGYREPRPAQMGIVDTRWHLSPLASFRPAYSSPVSVNGNRGSSTLPVCRALRVVSLPQALCLSS